MTRRRRELVLGLALCVVALSSLAPAQEDPAWGLLRAGTQVILVRHAATDMSQRDDKDAPLADCSRQRNLTDEGRADARRIREAFRLRAIPVGRVLSSPYCRRSEEHTSELQSLRHLVCRLLLDKKKKESRPRR